MMNVTFLFGLDRLLLAGYVFAVVFLNATMYLIAAFYQKKFGQATPKAGFVVSMLLSLVYAASLFVAVGGGRTLGIVQSSLLVIAAAASVVSAANLYFKMRTPRK